MVFLRGSGGTLVTPAAPTFDPKTDTITIPTTTGVEYRIDGKAVTGQQVITDLTEVDAVAGEGYYFAHNTDTDWLFDPKA